MPASTAPPTAAVPNLSTSTGVPDDSAAIADAYPRILRYVKRLVRDPAEAEDLTQETFLRAHRERAALHDPQARLAWLYRIATRVCIDRLRQRGRRPAASERAVEDTDPADDGPSLQQVIERDEMSGCVRAYIVGLPDDYRAVLLLRDLHGQTGPQVADVLGVSLATVKIRLNRARRRLAAALDAGCAFSRDERNVLVCEVRA